MGEEGLCEVDLQGLRVGEGGCVGEVEVSEELGGCHLKIRVKGWLLWCLDAWWMRWEGEALRFLARLDCGVGWEGVP